MKFVFIPSTTPKSQSKYNSQSICPAQSHCQLTVTRKQNKKKEIWIPRRRKPVLQWQGHHALELQAELKGQGRQKFDNQ
jgi:hypothetical protein